MGGTANRPPFRGKQMESFAYNFTDLELVLMRRDNITRNEARTIIREMRDRVFVSGEDPEEVLHENGLEPDYIWNLLD
jgi:predicted nucleic acid-binding protein